MNGKLETSKEEASLLELDGPIPVLMLWQDENPPQSEYEKKKQTFITRTIWTFVMIAAFFVALFSGHIYIIGIVTAIQIVSFKEVIAIANVPSRAKNLPFTRSLNWYFLGTTMYFLYGESVIYYFKHIVLIDKVLLPFATHHRFISFMLYVIGKCAAFHIFTNVTDVSLIRLRFLRSISQKGPLPFSVHSIRLDAHGALPHQCPSSLHHEQHFRRAHLVLPSRSACDCQRYFCLRLRGHIWTNTAHQAFAQKDRGRLRWGVDMHRRLGIRINNPTDQIQLLYLPRQCRVSRLYSSYFHLMRVHRTSALISSPASIAPQILSSSPTPTVSLHFLHHLPFPSSSASPKLSISPPFTFICKSSQPLHPSSRPSAASSPRASSALSKLRTLANPSPDMGALRIAWIANSSWACSHSCTIKVLLRFIKLLLVVSLRWPCRAWMKKGSLRLLEVWENSSLDRELLGRMFWNV